MNYSQVGRLMKLYRYFIILVLVQVILLVQGCRSNPLMIDSSGLTTLAQLGYENEAFPCQDQRETISFDYYLPADGAQGPKYWYIIHLSFSIEFDQASDETSRCVVSASTNGRCCSQVILYIRRVDDSTIVDWSMGGLLDKAANYGQEPKVDVIGYRNYLQVMGVVPGKNTLAVTHEMTNGSARVKSMQVFSDKTGLESTEIPPDE